MKLTLVTGLADSAVACTTVGCFDYKLGFVRVAAEWQAAGTASTKSKLIAAMAGLAAVLVATAVELERRPAIVAAEYLLAKPSVLGCNHHPPSGLPNS